MASYTEITRQSWLGRFGGAIKGVFVGLLFVPGACALLFWNEGRTVKTRRSLEEGAGAVVSVASDRVDAANEGKLVHLTGQAATADVLTDDLGVSATAIKLRRKAEMYQWREHKQTEHRNKTGGGSETITTYTYDQGWEDKRLEAESFKQPAGHENPPMPFPSGEWTATHVTLGAFALSPGLVERIHAWQPLPLSEVPERLIEKATLQDGRIYVGADPGTPKLGDQRLAYETVPALAVSVVARQVRATFEPYQTRAGRTIELLSPGTVSAEAMFQSEMRSNAVVAWLLRFAGWALMAIGIALAFRPFVVFADVLPFVGSMMGLGVGLFAVVAASGISFVVVGVAWFFYRPLLSIALVGAAGMAVIGAWYLGRSRKGGTS